MTLVQEIKDIIAAHLLSHPCATIMGGSLSPSMFKLLMLDPLGISQIGVLIGVRSALPDNEIILTDAHQPFIYPLLPTLTPPIPLGFPEMLPLSAQLSIQPPSCVCGSGDAKGPGHSRWCDIYE